MGYRRLRPHVLSVEYKLAYIKALSGDAKGALGHLEGLLFAHYPKYSFKVATDKDLDSLRKEPFRGQLDKLVEAARSEHVAAWKKAAFFIGANMRAFKYKRSVRGNQEIFGYVPETGRTVGVTYVDAANALGYLVTPDRQVMLYVAASKFDGPYVVDAAGKFAQVSPKHDAWDITWAGNVHALLQFGGQVGFVDVQAPSFTLLGAPAAHLRAFGPRAIKKCDD